MFDSSNRTSDDIDLLFTNIDENIMGNDWYSLSTEEWTYLLYERENAKNKNAKVNIYDENNVAMAGLLLFPDYYGNIDLLDDFDKPDNLTGYSISLEEWNEFEKFGVVFLPCSGNRATKDNIFSQGDVGCYWASDMPYALLFYNASIGSDLPTVERRNPSLGTAVRLVITAEE